MSTLIPNENSWIGFSTAMPADTTTLVPTEAEVAAATELTEFIISITASSQGNAVPTPNLKKMFETSIPGTSTAQFTAEMYRDSIASDDVAWNMLPRDTQGIFYISRFGGTGTDKLPIATDKVESWPVRVTSRSASAMSSNTAQTFTLTCSIPQEPNEDAVISSGGSTPPPAWAATTAYGLGDKVAIDGGTVTLTCTTAGTSDATEPAAPGAGLTVVDGTVTWTQDA